MRQLTLLLVVALGTLPVLDAEQSRGPAQTDSTPVGVCAAGAGSCIDTISDSTPEVDQEITLDGQGFHQESKDGWIPWFTSDPDRWSFEGTSPSDDGYVPVQGTSGDYVSDMSLIGAQSMYYNSARTRSPYCGRGGSGIGSDYNFVPSAGGRDLWFRWYARYEREPTINGWPTLFMKHWEWWEGGYYFQPNASPRPGQNPTHWTVFWVSGRGAGRNNTTPHPDGQIPNNRWMLIELHVADNVFVPYVNGHQVYSTTNPTVWKPITGFLIGIVNACSTSAWDVNLWVDGLAASSAGRIHGSSIIELCDRAMYVGAKCVMQYPTVISDTRVKFFLRRKDDKTTIRGGKGWIYVRNNAQQESAGIPVTVR